MKRLRLDRWTGQLLVARPPTTTPLRYARPGAVCVRLAPRRQQSTIPFSSISDGTDYDRFPPLEPLPPIATSFPSPTPDRALKSARLAALHARLSLPEKLPLQTLARTLVDISADQNPQFNNANLAFVGETLINYHVAEWLMVRYPRLPMGILWAAMAGYGGPTPLFRIAQSWGVQSTTTPGGEVDPGLLQFSLEQENAGTTDLKLGYQRTEATRKHKFRHSISSGVIMDDDYGQLILDGKTGGEPKNQGASENGDETPSHMRYGDERTRLLAEQANAHFVRAVVGSIYAHCGRDTVKAFIKSHIMSRTLDISKLFQFKNPLRELAMLCEREDFEPPIARLLSETGRLSRTPVFVVGIFSGNDKLGEAAGPSLDAARLKAGMNALKAWYLYSPGEHVRVPSDMLDAGAKPWEPAHIDMGEIISF